MSDLLLIGACAGGMAGVIMTLASHIAPRFAVKNFIRDTQRFQIFGYTITRREADLIGVFVHLVVSVLAGLGFAYGVEYGWIAGFHILPVLGWAVLLLLFSGAIVMPLEGHGFFGIKHDSWFILDVILTNLLWGGLYLTFVHLWI